MMESTFTLLRVRGIPIGVHWSWLFVFAIVVWSLATALFPATYPDLEGSTYVAMALAAAAVFFASVLLHELGHALRGVREGVPIEGITLWLLGGVARLRGNPPSPPAEFRVAIYGPLVTLVLTAAFGAAALVGDRLDWPASFQGVVDYLARINGLLLAFNMVPALPLDGGRVLRSWLWHRQQSFAAATRSAARVGQAFGLMLIAIGLLGLFDGGGQGGIWFVFLGWFLLQAAQAEVTMAEVRRALAGRKVGEVMTPDPVVVPPDLPVSDLIDRVGQDRRFSSFPVVEGGRPVGLVSLRMAAALPRAERDARTVADIMKPLGELPTATPDQDVVDVLPKLEGDPSRAVVTDGDRLVGVVSGRDVLRAVEAGALTAPPERARRAGPLVWTVVVIALLVAGAALYHPPYVVIAPGEATDAAADVRIEGVPVTPVNGRYLLTSVRLSQPSALRVLVALLRPDREVLRLSEVVPRGVDPDRYADRQRDVFTESQMLAAVAAARSQGLPVSMTGNGVRVVAVLRGSPAADVLQVGDVIVAVDGQQVTDAARLAQTVSSRPAGTRFRLTFERGSERLEREVTTARLPQLAGGVGLGVSIDTRGLDVDLPFEVSFARRNVGGPSAGLAYALAIADMLAEQDYARGRVIATTGTIDAGGEVGPVGGVEQKAVAADDAGAAVFLVPAGEVEAAEDADARVHGVETLRQALDALSAA
ncbi:MAG TPA: CBS domain-containing protein [Acidimicrobiales bacterium]|nr:CBS domain-containing protein [Acidimicrobiales bacterium]